MANDDEPLRNRLRGRNRDRDKPPASAAEALHRFSDRYLFAVIMLVLSIVVYAVTGDNHWGQLLTVLVQGTTLLLILYASHASRRLVLGAAVLVVVSLVIVVITGVEGLGNARGAVGIIGMLLAVVSPVAIVRRIASRRKIDTMTVAAALCIYLLAGLFFAYVYETIGAFAGPFFAQLTNARAIDYVYFSFVTLTTVGYGDLTSQVDLGRMLAVTEALFGQLYLVTAVAVLVSNVGYERQRARELADSGEQSRRAP